MTLAALKGMNFSVDDMAKAFRANPAAAQPSPPTGTKAKPEAAPSGMVDPMQLWGALTQQFQHIANSALGSVAQASQAAAQTVAARAGPGSSGKGAGAGAGAGAATKPARSAPTKRRSAARKS